MTTPTGQHITITLPNGKHARARVTYLQPKEERWREQSATIYITCNAWLDPY